MKDRRTPETLFTDKKVFVLATPGNYVFSNLWAWNNQEERCYVKMLFHANDVQSFAYGVSWRCGYVSL